MLGKDHTPYPNAGISYPESRLYRESIFKFVIFAVDAASLARVILISPLDAHRVSDVCMIYIRKFSVQSRDP